MAARSTVKKHYREPHAGRRPFSMAIGMKIYQWSGLDGSKEKQLSVDVFDPIRESWKQLNSKGDVPIGIRDGACAAIGNDMYTYGGLTSDSSYDGLHKLDTVTMQWSYIHPRSGVRPSPKTGVKMIAIGGDKLVMFGGYTPKVVKKGKTAFQKKTSSGGTCDELHMFDTKNGVWTAPRAHGDLPPPCCSFTLTAVDEKRAVLFGGTARGKPRSNELYIVHWDSMLWTKIPKNGAWPKSRKSPAACCINYGEPDPKILVSGGIDEDHGKLRDAWILNVNLCHWTQLPDLPRPTREGHILTAFSLSDKVVEVTMFGGTSYKDKKLADTTILHFDKEGNDWVLTNIIEPSDVGRPMERVQEKMESLGMLPSSVSVQSVGDDKPQGQPIPQTNGDSARGSLVRQDASFDSNGSLAHLSARSKRSYIISLTELTFGKQLGEGAYGTVFEGTWKDSEVAIKKCFNKPFDAEILSVLPRHPNVVLFYATATTEDATFIVTELVQNGALYDYIHQDKKEVNHQQGISWAKQIAYGMEHLHGHHIVHRDLKSANVLISEDMTLKVCDFGTARAVVDTCEQSTVRGTYRWMAPEIMKEDDAIINKMCDVYSYGCVLYELFEKKLPYYQEKNSLFLAMKVLEGLRPTIADDTSTRQFLQDLMKACWLENPEERPQFEDCITALRMKSFKDIVA